MKRIPGRLWQRLKDLFVVPPDPSTLIMREENRLLMIEMAKDLEEKLKWLKEQETKS